MTILHSPAKSGRRALVAASLILSPALFASSADALEFKFSDLTMQLDTTVSVSAAMRTEGRDCSHISYFNGGCLQSDGSGWDVNNDDGNINVEQGEIFSMPYKVVSELSGQWRNYGFYVSGKAFFDPAARDIDDGYNEYGPIIGGAANPHGGRPLNDGARSAKKYAMRDIKLLDAYAYADWDIAGMPLNVRLGRQVVSWGESTFIQGGVSSYLPFDVAALYQPGLELKEVFLPQGTAYASLGLPGDVTLEAMYIYEHEKSELPACGTLFSVSDALGQGCAYGIALGDYNRGLEAGVFPPPSYLPRIGDEKTKDEGQYGFALRHYADWLGQGTDLGLYFVNFHSKLPIGTFTALDDPSGTLGLASAACGGNLMDPVNCAGPSLTFDYPGSPIDNWAIAGTTFYYGMSIYGGSLAGGGKKLLAQYPEDIKMIGASFNTSVTMLPAIFGDGTAISGDLAYYPNMPFQVDTTELLAHDFAAVGFTANPGEAPIYTGEMVAAGQVIPGYRRTKALHGSLTSLSTLTPSNWFVRNTGGDFTVLLINAGFQYLPDSDNNRFAIPGSNKTHANPGVGIAVGDVCQVSSGVPTQNCSLSARYASAFSTGYRIYAFQDYHSAFNTGWTIEPHLYWSHDVSGYSAGPIGPGFVKGKKVLSLGVDALYQGFKAGVSYTMHMGAENRNVDYDKNFVAMTVSYAF
ncbi:DUF1302 domain-containing protein [Parvibaculum sp.]|uniref:DUF1302 domain-containing protein n=1 Tax=Parvibaculum sp. TaxID=2024848 RepID=UPI000C96EB40|nr:DUF1302 domain-containing protein [Parvibaculum sp.]MAB14013.1 hypothetical protein [Parvibaculum sp.]